MEQFSSELNLYIYPSLTNIVSEYLKHNEKREAMFRQLLEITQNISKGISVLSVGYFYNVYTRYRHIVNKDNDYWTTDWTYKKYPIQSSRNHLLMKYNNQQKLMGKTKITNRYHIPW